MKKVFCLFFTAVLLACSLCGCVVLPEKKTSYPDGSQIPGSSSVKQPKNTNAEDVALKTLQQKINYHSKGAGVAFIGYVDSQSTEAELRSYITDGKVGKTYPFILNAPMFLTEGQELYAIVPPCDKGRITVYASDITEDGQYTDDRTSPLYEGKNGEPLLLRCNLSEIYSNVLVTATDGGGAIDFRPSLSMENGHLQEIAGVYDFSIYEETPDERSVQIATEILLEADEVKNAVESGMKIIYTGDTQMIEGRPCLLFALGTDSEEQFVREHYYGVCDNLIYVYDAVSDTWAVLGRE
ncbi:hypothetical protein [Yeguia hominis]|uniref:Uncharacterized protein n=1 Tax=Yeguia hominis TaxID=2763662 RepID=A0A926D6Q8_9FIRM|nr:hypothetical protein [Yeguia hominis]MBC8533425.1 hypothetical protein [Yeguia hominis]